LKRFSAVLGSEDREIFDDLLDQCRLYASFASTMTSPVKQIPLIISMLFGQHKRLMELEKRINRADESERTNREESLLGFMENS
jgi:hypothetical protein